MFWRVNLYRETWVGVMIGRRRSVRLVRILRSNIPRFFTSLGSVPARLGDNSGTGAATARNMCAAGLKKPVTRQNRNYFCVNPDTRYVTFKQSNVQCEFFFFSVLVLNGLITYMIVVHLFEINSEFAKQSPELYLKPQQNIGGYN